LFTARWLFAPALVTEDCGMTGPEPIDETLDEAAAAVGFDLDADLAHPQARDPHEAFDIGADIGIENEPR
jgi:hypothetical protein